MTRSELVRALAASRGLPVKAADEVVDVIFGTFEEALIEGGSVELRGFGSFKVRESAGYTTRNPATGEPIDVPTRQVPVFKPGRALREAVALAGELELQDSE